MTARRSSVIGLIARREYVERARARSFVVSTGITMLLVVAAVVVPTLLRDRGPTTYRLGLLGTASADLAPTLRELAAASGARLETTEVVGVAEAEYVLRNGRVEAVLVDGSRLMVVDEATPELAALVQEAVQRSHIRRELEASGVTAESATRALSAPPVPVQALDPPDEDATERRAAATVGSILLYLALLSYGLWVATGVVEEKATRVVEILLSTVRPPQLLAGKVVGIGLLGLTQLAFFGVAALGAALAVGRARISFGALTAVPSVLLWFVLGYAFYACAYAAAGASVSRQEELQGVTAPFTILIVLSYFLSFASVERSSGLLVRLASFLPPLAPAVMQARTTVGSAAWWEVVLAIVIMVAATLGLVQLAGRIYSGAILRTGPRVRLRSAWRSTAA